MVTVKQSCWLVSIDICYSAHPDGICLIGRSFPFMLVLWSLPGSHMKENASWPDVFISVFSRSKCKYHWSQASSTCNPSSDRLPTDGDVLLLSFQWSQSVELMAGGLLGMGVYTGDANQS